MISELINLNPCSDKTQDALMCAVQQLCNLQQRPFQDRKLVKLAKTCQN